jgi:hypothetical protein
MTMCACDRSWEWNKNPRQNMYCGFKSYISRKICQPHSYQAVGKLIISNLRGANHSIEVNNSTESSDTKRDFSCCVHLTIHHTTWDYCSAILSKK